MRRLVANLAALVFLLPAAAASQTGSDSGFAWTTANVWLRDAPAPAAKAMAKIAKGTRVSVADCAEEWCSVGYRAMGGFVAERYLSRDSASAQVIQQGRGYINSRGQWVPSPTRTQDGRPPAGASAQCRDSTYSFSQSRRGTCSHHGGVARWLR